MKTPKRILYIRTDRIGDVILTTPAVGVLKNNYPDVHITFLAREYTRPLLAQHPQIDEIITYQPEGKHKGFFGHLRLAKELKTGAYDAAILFYPRPTLAMAAWLAGIPQRIGVGYRWYSPLINHRFYEHRKKGNKHELTHNLTLLSPFLEIDDKTTIEFGFQLSSEAKTWWDIECREKGLQAGYIIIHPGSGGSAPNLTIQQYRHLTRQLLEDTNQQILFTGAATEADIIKQITTGLPTERLRNLTGNYDLQQLCTVISQSSLMIASSTGPLHIANAFRVPVLSYYCPSPPCSPRRWGPYGQEEWVLLPNVTPCNHCQPARCPNGNCVSQISEKELQEMLSRRLASLK